jgi:peptidoglycan/LPS O-acetylase OafA/YrhL
MRRLPQLDGLRGIAVLLVVADHYVLDTHVLGELGVYIFFSLSGYLVTSILLASRADVDRGCTTLWSAFFRFYARRALRIFPLYYAVLLLGFALNLPSFRGSMLWHSFYLTNVVISMSEKWHIATVHFWSLSIEEQFYLLFPLLILLAPLRKLRLIIAVLIAASLAYQLGMYTNTHWGVAQPYFLLPSALASLGLGSLMTVEVKTQRALQWIIPPVLIALILLLRLHIYTGRDTLIAVIAAAAVGCALTRKVSALEKPPLVYLGTISYGIYLLHQPIIFLLSYTHPILAWWSTVLTAALSWRFFEAPINSLKCHFEIRKGHVMMQTISNPLPLGAVGDEALGRIAVLNR